MALTGVHVACCFAGSERGQERPAETLRKPEWSETMASAGTTTKSAPEAADNGNPLYHVASSLDIFCAAGKAPDPVNGPRLFVKAGEPASFYVSPGDKFAWVAA
ncbi:hypothetical protein J2045_003321 [Peteryoungia aggregata LMG 23059]|uniref:Uncharacterized protein n=1 Tax=Peteryoungia aggregata LMG 23059 TaxID=1368425 RepID=A0ABU0GAY8_9HYPH|nr:hypothetical protein [Peteryoungia aggregata]MDQ0422273.1 hypothetical protein [Peteryoungia aggregata LMG 23059]